MKTLLITILILISTFSFSQEIERNQEYVYKLKGIVEIDGHHIDNNTTDNPFYVKVTLEKLIIYDKNGTEYTLRKCSKENCKIIHLVPLLDANIGIYDGIIEITPTIHNYEFLNN